jgi:hypothetical protein
MMSTSTFTRAAFLAVGVTLFAGGGGLAAPLPTNVAAMRSLAPQSTTEARWGGVGWHGGGWGYHHWAGHGWGYRGWGGHGWGWGPAATGALAGGGYYGSRYYGGGHPYHDDAGYPPYDVEYDDEDCAPYGGYYRSDYGW